MRIIKQDIRYLKAAINLNPYQGLKLAAGNSYIRAATGFNL